jgi:glycosyltransferase involved in cell wall biosynthesis
LTQGVIALSSEWEHLRDVVPHCPVYPLPNAIDLRPYRTIAQERLGRTQIRRPVHVFYIGCLGSAKGTFDLIQAAAKMHMEAVFDLVGEELRPGARAQLENLVEVLHLAECVHLHGPAFDKEKMEFFQRADIFVYPSYDEGMPMAIVEAMASGLPIVASRVGGLPDLVQDGVNGLLVDAGDPDQIVDAISRIANDDEMRLSMQRQAYREACERFDVEQLVSRLVKIYEVVTAGNLRTALAIP